MRTSRIVVLGGCGNFGARICRALAGDPRIEVIAAGRSPPGGPGDGRAAGAWFARVDIAAPDFAAALKKLAPQILIHCAGPFQNQDYRVALAAIAAGAHYIDLADGRQFVTGFADAIDAAARAAGLLAVCGASTLPALSSAVVDALAGRLAELQEIDIVIAPGQRAPRGAATIAGVLSYAGRPPHRTGEPRSRNSVHGGDPACAEARRRRASGGGCIPMHRFSHARRFRARVRTLEDIVGHRRDDHPPSV